MGDERSWGDVACAPDLTRLDPGATGRHHPNRGWTAVHGTKTNRYDMTGRPHATRSSPQLARRVIHLADEPAPVPRCPVNPLPLFLPSLSRSCSFFVADSVSHALFLFPTRVPCVESNSIVASCMIHPVAFLLSILPDAPSSPRSSESNGPFAN